MNPASAMFREGTLLLREEPAIADPTSYAATLSAISAGNHRRSETTSFGALPKLILFARSGFSAALVRLAGGRPDVELVPLDRLYGGH
ncbi:hypothetical protein OG320_12280 [Microbispora sp. NBC_01189]|uniref:hypothetical protein n=1 Tax=Microbispora sp. NBC_01189 TaxID=2903583 RepID=UPI002E0EE9D5|nr:hypothetical protein OG320_12280 [Microbispora sp. NBC_01189]